MTQTVTGRMKNAVKMFSLQQKCPKIPRLMKMSLDANWLRPGTIYSLNSSNGKLFTQSGHGHKLRLPLVPNQWSNLFSE